jgi:dihydrofolate reductase
MRKLLTNTFVTVDGVVQAPGGSQEDTSGGFRHGGWSVNYWDDGMGEIITQSMSKPFDLLLGRKTYEIFAAHWPFVADDPVADALNGARKFVASRSLKSVEWNNATLITGDVAEYVARLKDASGPEIQIHGSGELIQTLLKRDLIDEYRLWIFPVVLGEGKRLFASGTLPAALRLADAKTSSTGVAIHTYERAGAIEYGSFEVDVEGETSKLWSESRRA